MECLLLLPLSERIVIPSVSIQYLREYLHSMGTWVKWVMRLIICISIFWGTCKWCAYNMDKI